MTQTRLEATVTHCFLPDASEVSSVYKSFQSILQIQIKLVIIDFL